MQQQKLLINDDIFAGPPNLGEQFTHPPAALDVEPKSLGEVLEWVRGGVRGHILRPHRTDAFARKVDPRLIAHAIGLVHFSEDTLEFRPPGQRPVVVEEAVPAMLSRFRFKS